MVVADPGPGMLMRRLLEEAGHETIYADTVPSALKAIEAARPACSAVLADRDSDLGDLVVTLLQRTRSFGPAVLAWVPFIIIGSNTTKQFLLWESGVDAYVLRPAHAEELTDAINDVLDRSDNDRLDHRADMISDLSRQEVDA